MGIIFLLLSSAAFSISEAARLLQEERHPLLGHVIHKCPDGQMPCHQFYSFTGKGGCFEEYDCESYARNCCAHDLSNFQTQTCTETANVRSGSLGNDLGKDMDVAWDVCYLGTGRGGVDPSSKAGDRQRQQNFCFTTSTAPPGGLMGLYAQCWSPAGNSYRMSSVVKKFTSDIPASKVKSPESVDEDLDVLNKLYAHVIEALIGSTEMSQEELEALILGVTKGSGNDDKKSGADKVYADIITALSGYGNLTVEEIDEIIGEIVNDSGASKKVASGDAKKGSGDGAKQAATGDVKNGSDSVGKAAAGAVKDRSDGNKKAPTVSNNTKAPKDSKHPKDKTVPKDKT